MGRGASRGTLELEDDPQLGHRLHIILHGLWFRGYPPDQLEASLEDAIDQLDEAHDVTLLCSAKY